MALQELREGLVSPKAFASYFVRYPLETIRQDIIDYVAEQTNKSSPDRTMIAAMAMQANADNEDMTPGEIARLSVEMADALIAALKKEPI